MDWHKRAEDALDFLTKTDGRIAELRVEYERDKRKAKSIWAAQYLRLDQGTVEQRKSEVETSPAYLEAQGNEIDSLLAYEKLKHQRETAALVIEFWRSWNRATRDGVL